VVCTANVCRSVMAEAFLRQRLPGASVRSVGLLPRGRVADPDAVAALASRGVDASEHLSTQLDRKHLRGVDLVVGLERQHVREAVVLDRDVFPRAFTLRELVRRAETAGPRPPMTPVAAWLAELHAGRDTADLFGDAPDDDIADPTGGAPAGYEHTARWIDALVGRLVALLWPSGYEDDDRAERAERAERAATVDVGPAPRADAQVELWRHHLAADGVPGVVGVVSDRAGIRLARGIEATLHSLGFGLFDLANDAWVATGWAQCAEVAARAVASGHIEAAISLTASGTGAAMLANRHPGVRAATATDVTAARRARRAWGANVLCLGVEEVTVSEAEDVIAAFLREPADVPNELDDRPAPPRRRKTT
jgi:RpiB/LacA/LacB family sugar-phosphate isomerase